MSTIFEKVSHMMHKTACQNGMAAGSRHLFNRKERCGKVFFTNRDAMPVAFVQVSLRDLKGGPACLPVPASVVRSYMMKLAQNGALTEAGFLPSEVEAARCRGVVPTGYQVEQIVPMGCGARPTLNNICLMESGLQTYLTRHLWRLLHRDLVAEKAACEKKGRPYEQISIGLSGFRAVMRVTDWTRVLDKPLLRRARLVEEQLKVQQLKAMPLAVVATANGVLLAHPAFMSMNAQDGYLKNATGMVPAVVNVRLASAHEQQAIKAEYGQVRRDIIRAFAARGQLPEIRPDKQRVIAQTGWLPDRYPYTCHHIVPRALGGSNEAGNVCWLPAAEHADLHVIVNKYQHELKTRYADLATRGLAYLVLPIPASFQGPQLRIISPVDQRLVSIADLADAVFACHPAVNIRKKKGHFASQAVKRRLLVAKYQRRVRRGGMDVSRVHI